MQNSIGYQSKVLVSTTADKKTPKDNETGPQIT